ncbi:MAG: Asp-tRNA(Asn)/Glu-tRNA(Gln) amidotransferase subunit GatA [Flavobacteriales bacterium]|nr:Asp-tRNA(Asn)/Glu-tRNA(Gln) amidotransferase subunit GatA [Flavobacteriales bacterium]
MEYTRIADVQADIRAGKTTLPHLVDHYLSQISAKEDLNVFLEVWDEESRAQAAEIQQKIDDGTAGRLAGAVIAIKDNLCVKDHKVSAASQILGGFESIYTATAVQRLLDEDAILIGRTNCDEFAMGSSNENSAYGPVKNPLDESKVPGGSSGGSAAAVAADMCIASLGSDTGGSIRQPASFCGVVGLKPTYGRISRYGLIAYASSFDQIGPFTHSVDDAVLLTSIMAGKDAHDSTSSSQEVEAFEPSDHKMRIAYISECLDSKGISDEVKEDFQKKIDALQAQGHTVEPVSFDLLDHMIPAYYVLTTAEASSNLARFDGIHYGYRSEKATDIDSTYLYSRSEGFGAEVQRRIMLGTFVLSAGYYDAYYSKAQKVRRIVQDRTEKIFEQYDLLMTPTAPSSAFGLDSVKDPIAMYLQDIFTVQSNLAGIPAISLPLMQDKGLPVGLQFMAPRFEENRLYEISVQMLGYTAQDA